MDKTKFQHRISVRVRNIEIDWQGIVHNANYLLYFEDGRVAYLEHLGIKVDISSMDHEYKVLIVRNEIDYVSPARLGELLDVYTRISFVRNTSFAFEAILEESKTGRRIAENVSIHVTLDHKTDKPIPVPEVFRRKVHDFEGDNVVIKGPTHLV
jgi:acyl-CoA thioester hydrolase